MSKTACMLSTALFSILLCLGLFGSQAFASESSAPNSADPKLPIAAASTSGIGETQLLTQSSGFSVYPTIALKSSKTGKYLTGTLNGQFAWSNTITADARLDLLWPAIESGSSDIAIKSLGLESPSLGTASSEEASPVDSQSASGDVFGMQSLTNRRYIGVDGGLNTLHPFGFYDSFMTDNASLKLVDESGNYLGVGDVTAALYNGESVSFRIRTAENAIATRWLSFDEEGNQTLVGSADKATLFSPELVDSNHYTDEDFNVLTSDEWFNIDGTDLGYWDIQAQVGAGKVDALRTLGYTIMKSTDKDVITLRVGMVIDLQCAVGVKKTQRGEKTIYDVIIAFQGTAGYSEDEMFGWLVDSITNIKSSIDQETGLHAGYKSASDELWSNASRIACTLDGKRLTLAQLLNRARAYKETAHITLLGHSMGGAIAQCFAEKLASHDVLKESITGRTFESALATSRSDKDYTDWYNICINTDSVSNGTVPNSLLQKAGIHRIGKTIVMFDPHPNQDIDTLPLAGIALAKHDMTMAVKPLLQQYGEAYVEELTREGLDGTWVTAIKGAQSNYGPYASSGVANNYPKAGTVVNPVGFKENKYGNRWFKLDDDSWMYEGNITKLSTYQKSKGAYYVISNSAPLREICYQEGEVIKTSITNARVTNIVNKTYSGKAQAQALKVKFGSVVLQEGKDYTVTYSNNKNVGKATVTVKGAGIFDGEQTKVFDIIPKMVSIKKPGGAIGGVVVKWNKVAKQADGYQVQVALNKKFTKGMKAATIKKAGATSKKITKLKKGKKYFVRIRAYKKVGSTTYYGQWSKVKKVRTKK